MCVWVAINWGMLINHFGFLNPPFTNMPALSFKPPSEECRVKSLILRDVEVPSKEKAPT